MLGSFYLVLVRHKSVLWSPLLFFFQDFLTFGKLSDFIPVWVPSEILYFFLLKLLDQLAMSAAQNVPFY